jgi:hypothetical protein
MKMNDQGERKNRLHPWPLASIPFIPFLFVCIRVHSWLTCFLGFSDRTHLKIRAGNGYVAELALSYRY